MRSQPLIDAVSITGISARGIIWHMAMNNKQAWIWKEAMLSTFVTVWY
jgi:hypothetical protein